MVLKLIEYSNDMDGIYKNIGEMNLNKKHKILLVFDDTIADMLSNKRLNRIVAELSIKDRQLNISLVFITQSYFAVSQNQTKFCSHFIMKILNKREIQQIVYNHLSDIDFENL